MKTDPPETWNEFFWRVVIHRLVPNWALEDQKDWINSFRPDWIAQEKEKADYQKQLQREAQEHEKTVNHLQAQIEREKDRIAREEYRKREREARDEQRKREKTAEEERRDPTPIVGPASTIPAIPFNIRDQHIFIPGMTRHGKSSVMFHLIMNDIVNGRGVAVLDPIKGDLVKLLCAYIPKERLKDVLYTDLYNTIPLDLLNKTDHPEFIVGDIKELVLKGDATLKRAEPHLTDLIYSLLSIDNSSFMDIAHFFKRPDRQKQIIDDLEKSEDKYYYGVCKEELSKLPRAEWSPLTSRMNDFTANPNLREAINKPYGLDIRKAMDERKIILVNLAGTGETPEIYGTLLMAQFQQAAYSRNDIPPYERVPFCLYADEFHQFQTKSFSDIISIGGGLGLNLTLATQYLMKLTDEVRHAVQHVGTYIIFKLREHVELFSTQVHPYKPYRIGLLPRYQAIYKVGDDAPEFHWTKAPPPYLKPQTNYVKQLIPELIQQTKAYIDAQCSQKRTVDRYACGKSPVSHTEGNGNYDDIEGQAVQPPQE